MHRRFSFVQYLFLAVCVYMLLLLTTFGVGTFALLSLQRDMANMQIDNVRTHATLLKQTFVFADALMIGQLKKTPLILIYEIASIGESGALVAHTTQTYLAASLGGDEQTSSLSLDALSQSSFRLRADIQTFSMELQRYPWIYNRLSADRKKLLHTAVDLSQSMQILLQSLPAMTGPGEKRYLVLLQNNMELRPTGGFLGSFAYITFKNGAMKSLEVKDIYVPDGQLKGYVEAPEPLKLYLQQTGGWKLRDANWDPDLPTSAQTIVWFFEHGGYTDIDGVVSLNLGVMQNLLTALGPINVPDYHETVSAENFYSLVQVETEQSFFPGATNKTDILSALSRAVLRELKALPQDKQIAVGRVVFNAAQQRDLAMWFKEPGIQQAMHTLGWDGSTQRVVCNQQNCVADNLYIVEANLGANKTNCCISRSVTYDAYIHNDGTVSRATQIDYVNDNPASPQPPRYYGGGYLNFLRIYTNPEATPVNLILDGDRNPNHLKNLRGYTWDELGVNEYGFLTRIEGGEKKSYIFEVNDTQTLDLTRSGTYAMLIQRQPGIRTNNYTVRLHYPESMRVSGQNLPGTVTQTSGVIELRLALEETTELHFSLETR